MERSGIYAFAVVFLLFIQRHFGFLYVRRR